MMDILQFLLHSLWFAVIAVIVNIVMENLWNRQNPAWSFDRDDRGSIEPDQVKPRHRQ